MPIRGWYARYSELLKEFGYLKSTDTKAAKILNEIIKKPVPENKFRRLIAGKTVFVIGAGPSLNQTIQTARKMKATKIVADSAVKAALKAGIIPDIVLTDQAIVSAMCIWRFCTPGKRSRGRYCIIT